MLNKGVSGEAAEEAASRLDRDVIRDNPSLVIVEFGVNEAYRGYPLERALAGIERIVQRVQSATDAEIIVVGVHFWSYQENFDDGLADISRRFGTGLVLDVLDGIVSSQRTREDGDARLRHDAFHPNAAGYARMSARIQPEVERLLATGARAT